MTRTKSVKKKKRERKLKKRKGKALYTFFGYNLEGGGKEYKNNCH